MSESVEDIVTYGFTRRLVSYLYIRFLIRLDYDGWKHVAGLCSKWSDSDIWDVLSHRMFKIMDGNHDGFINFKDLVLLLDMMCGADLQKKLKLLYCNL